MIEEFISRSLILALGYAYPAYLCFKTLEKNRVAIQDLRFWCQYWIIVATLAILESFSDVLISWFPMYRMMKLGLYIYLWHPSTRGSENVYENLLRPHLLRYEENIDRSLFEAKERALNLVIYYWHDCTKLGSTMVIQFFQFVVTQSASIRLQTSQLQLQNAGYEAANVSPPPPPQNAGNEAENVALPPPPPATPPTTPSANFKRNTSEKWRPPLGHPTTPQNVLPKSESMKVRLLSQTQFIHPQDFLPDQDQNTTIDETSDSEHEDGDKIKSH